MQNDEFAPMKILFGMSMYRAF